MKATAERCKQGPREASCNRASIVQTLCIRHFPSNLIFLVEFRRFFQPTKNNSPNRDWALFWPCSALRHLHIGFVFSFVVFREFPFSSLLFLPQFTHLSPFINYIRVKLNKFHGCNFLNLRASKAGLTYDGLPLIALLVLF